MKIKKKTKRKIGVYSTAICWAIYAFFGIDLLNASFLIANIVGVLIPIALLIISYKYFKKAVK